MVEFSNQNEPLAASIESPGRWCVSFCTGGNENSMTRSIILLSMVAMAGSGCVVYTGGGGGGGGGVRGDVQFNWSFAGGATCSDYPEVAKIRVTIPGQSLMNAGVFNCLVSNYPGIVLTNFAPGTYSYTVDALGYADEQLFTATGTFRVNGSVTVNVDLVGLGGSSYLRWSLPGYTQGTTLSCEQGGVTTMVVRIDNAAPISRSCSEGQTIMGWQTPQLAPGSHTLSLSATDNSGYEYFHFDGTLVVAAGEVRSDTFTMQWSVGTMRLAVRLVNGSVQQSCQQAGVTQVVFHIRDSAGKYVYGNDGAPATCADAANFVDFFLPPDVYGVYVAAVGTGNATYETSRTNLPNITVQAGVFPSQPLVLSATH